MKINKPLIVFGSDSAVTYPLLLAIAQRRELEQMRQEKLLRMKTLLWKILTILQNPCAFLRDKEENDYKP
jgi:hypothetical protein